MRSGKVILQGLLCFMIVFSLVLPLTGCESPPAAPEPDAISTVQALTSSGLADSPWPKFGQNAQSTGQSPYRGPDRPYLKWSFTTAECVYSSPAIGVDGTIYFGSNDHKLYAINPDGSEKWSFTTQYYVDSSPAIGADGTIYVGSYDRKLYAINPDGSEKWSFTTGDLVASSPAIGEDGAIYVGSVDRKLYAINPDGSKRWSFTAGHSVPSSPAIGADGTVYVGSDDRKLYAINPDGSQKWSFTTGADVFSSPAIGVDGTIYVGSFDNRLYAINPDGSKKWSFTTAEAVRSSPAIGADGTIYVGSRDKKLHAINPDGSQRWSFTTGFWVESSPAIGADGTIYVGSDDRKLYAINPDGSQKWSFTTGGLVRSSPAIGADGTVYFGSGRERKLYAITAAYHLTVSSTAWGAVAEPGEGQFTYPGGTAVDLVAEADEGYRFTNWTGDVGTIDDVDDPETTITMNGDYSIVANFEAEEVAHFPDPNLEGVIRHYIGKPTGDIYRSDLVGLTILRAAERGISDLTGLEHCVDLQTVHLCNNEISDVTPLSTLTSLTKLLLWDNQIADVSQLSSLTNLNNLHIHTNQITDVSHLSSLTNLYHLHLGANQISDITPLGLLVKLTGVALHNNEISDVSPLGTLANLNSLHLASNQISDISPLRSLTNLHWIELWDNEISDISPLVDNHGLGEGNYLKLRYNHLSLAEGSQAMTDIQALVDRGVNVCYEPQKEYALTVYPTAGGVVTVPGEGTSAHYWGTLVDLVAEADVGYQFLNWSGDVSTIDNVNSASTTIAITGDFSITANFESTTASVETSTGTGIAHFTTSHGVIEDLQALPSLPPAPPANIRFPHGMFSFKVTGIDLGQTVTLTVELPGTMPSGTRWWKEHMGAWYSIPVTVVEPNVISFTLTDGVFPGDSDGTQDGVITDPGGPGNPVPSLTVGWEGSPVNKAAVMAPWIALLAVMAGVSLLVLRRRQAQI